MRGSSDNETGALILAMDEGDLASLVGVLREGMAADLPLFPATSQQGTSPVARLRLRPSEAASLLVKVSGDEAKITGSPENLSRWADELLEFERENDLDEPGMHVHFDPSQRQFGGLEMSSESAELIVTGPIPDS